MSPAYARGLLTRVARLINLALMTLVNIAIAHEQPHSRPPALL
jgi:hypothetical protein